jgi:hypothetical protein
MDPRDIVDAYLQGRIESWGVFRRLTRLGLSTATALAVAAALPGAVRANDAEALKAVGHTAQESPLVDLLMSHLAAQLERVEAGGPIRPLATTLARIGGNNSNLLKCGDRTDCDPIKLNVNDGFNNLNGELVPDPSKGNMTLNVNGSIGQSNVNLFGFLDQPNNNNNANNNNGNNANVGNVNMNFVGNVGEVPLNLNGNLGNLNTGKINDPK